MMGDCIFQHSARFSQVDSAKVPGHLAWINPDDCNVGREQDIGIGLGALAAISTIEKLLHSSLTSPKKILNVDLSPRLARP